MRSFPFRLFRAFAMLETGLDCRRCGEAIVPSDHHGLSEGVCPACRS
jgi:hypothetical protein